MEFYIGNSYGIGYRKLLWNLIKEIPMELVGKISSTKSQNKTVKFFFVLQKMLYLASFLTYIKNC